MTRLSLIPTAVIALTCAVLAATIALALLGWPWSAYRDSDFVQYYAGARSIVEGATPYDHTWWTEFHERVGSRALHAPPHSGGPGDWTTPYPLWTFVLLVPFALIPPAVAAPFFAASQFGLVLGATLALGSVALTERRRDLPLALAIVAFSEPLWTLTAGGNVSGFAAAAFAFALAALLAGRPRVAGALLVGCLLKPHLFVIAGIALVASAGRFRRDLILSASVSTAVLTLVTFALDPGWIAQWLGEAARLEATSFSNATGWTIARPFLSDYIGVSTAVVVVTVLALALWAVRQRPAPLPLVAASLPVSVLVAPHGWSYDLIALLPCVVYGLERANVARARAVALAIVVVVAVLLPWVLLVGASARNSEDIFALYPILVAMLIGLVASIGARSREPV